MIGRDADLARVRRWLDTAAAGSACVAHVHGDAGIGKSSLVGATREEARARDFTVLGTQGRAADAEIGFASLLTLLRPYEAELDELAGDTADDVRAALALGRRVADPIGVHLGVFRILASLAERAPVLVVADDADHLDAATARALAFAFGRLDADPVCAVLTSEGELPEELAALPSGELLLGPLAEGVVASVVTARADLDDAVLAEVVHLARGNPLAAIELTGSLTEDERKGLAPFPGVPRPSAAVRRGFEARLAAVSEPTRRALAVVAADDVGDPVVIASALARLGEPDDGLAEAEAVGLLVRDGSRIRLAHPLLRAVAYHQVAPASRRAAHRALAGALDRPDQAAARAWQLAAAAAGPDETAAAALALVADDALRRGSPESAARTLERAAALTPDPVAAQRRLAEAVERWIESDPHRARVVAARLGPPLDPDVAAVLAATGAGPFDPPDGEFTPEFTALRAEHALEHGDDTAAAALAREVCADDAGAAALLAGAVLVRAGAPVPGPAPRPGGSGAFARHAWDAWLDARVAVGFVENDRAPLGGDIASVLRTARVDLLQGRARAAADRIRGRVQLRGGDEAALVLAEAELWAGAAPAVADVEEILTRAEAAANARVVAYASWLLGRASDRDGALERAATLDPARFGADAVGALVAAGRTAPARSLAEQLDRFTDAGPLLRARALRARAVAGIDRAAFDAALATCDEHGLVVEAIETLRASGAADDARARARMADLRYFDRKAAAVRDAPPLRDRLSAAEMRVAEVVASGLTNRQAAEALFLSVKTVDFHLQQIYRKLGVRTRTQLAVLVSRDSDPAEGGS